MCEANLSRYQKIAFEANFLVLAVYFRKSAFKNYLAIYFNNYAIVRHYGALLLQELRHNFFVLIVNILIEEPTF